MKPDWDKLMAEFKDSKTALVADVDCTAAGKSLCNKVGVRGYPTIKHGDPNNLEDYKGGRDLSSLQKFASENLGPSCGPDNLDLCDAEKRKILEDFMTWDTSKIKSTIEENEKTMKDEETKFENAVKELQERYQKLQSDKEETINKLKDSGLGMMKAVLAKKTKDEL